MGIEVSNRHKVRGKALDAAATVIVPRDSFRATKCVNSIPRHDCNIAVVDQDTDEVVMYPRVPLLSGAGTQDGTKVTTSRA